MQDFKGIFSEATQGFSIFPRSFSIQEGKIHLYGPPKSGKTSLALFFAKSFKYPIYIDCTDTRNDPQSLAQSLLKAFLEKRLDLLILDHYNPILNLPNIKNIILITQDAALPHADFASKQILPLSFEEYIAIANQTSLTQSLNHFIKFGNLPEMHLLHDYQKFARLKEIMQLFFGMHFPIFLSLLSFQSQKISIHQLYLHLKKTRKISKDTLYCLLARLESMGFITFLPHLSTQGAKKLYLYNFALPYAFLPSPSFQAIFENMTFLELKNQCPHPLFFEDHAHFTANNQHFYAIAFPNPALLDKIALKHPKATIISINQIPHKTLQILDFISFALGEWG